LEPAHLPGNYDENEKRFDARSKDYCNETLYQNRSVETASIDKEQKNDSGFNFSLIIARMRGFLPGNTKSGGGDWHGD
jgi:hypothetical protein